MWDLRRDTTCYVSIKPQNNKTKNIQNKGKDKRKKEKKKERKIERKNVKELMKLTKTAYVLTSFFCRAHKTSEQTNKTKGNKIKERKKRKEKKRKERK